MTKTQLLTPKETAEMLGVSTNTLSNWRVNKRYDLPYVPIGRSIRYRLQDVEAFIEARVIAN